MVEVGVLLPTRESVMYDGGSGDPRPLVALAQQAEALGYDSVWAGDSLLAKPRAEPLTLLAGVAAVTERVALGTAVLIASQRNPEQLAQATATLDALSGGRFILGIGAGPGADNVRRDHELVGANFAKRSSRAIEVAERVRSLWTGAEGDQMYPLPGRPGGPPIWIGGEGPKTLERTGRMAELEEHSELYYGAPHRAISKFQGSCAGSADKIGQFVAEFVEAGAQHLCVRFGSRDVAGQIDAFAPIADALRREP